ncbi:hypothetical protein [Leptospira noguchii]|uniref:hypothetical protein n=1 Tax=Leptospira noguchii TaxID=28182 RepID=UPI000AEFCE81|nr:hypothetical protein [Leptospira noguchii]
MLRSALSLEIPKVAFETQQNALYGSRETQQNALYGSRFRSQVILALKYASCNNASKKSLH